MRANSVLLPIVMLLLTGPAALAESQRPTGLRNNPFSRPDILKPKPPPPPARPHAVAEPEPKALLLTATLVSRTTPMVVVDGELIGIGEKVQGFELISVTEGAAVFVRGSRKFAFEVGGDQPK